MSASIEILRTAADLRAWRRSITGTVGFVPTMGALHDGHAELLRTVRPRCETSVLSIFVNPTQFGPREDLARYPRTFEADLAVARSCEIDAIYAPTPEEMYPPGFSTWVEETVATVPLCGRFRPGHFRGVTTVVLKLLNLVRPRLALFGLKDAQQFFVLHKMARDLALDVAVEGVATVRESDGLALSSRNAYLSADERRRAPAIRETLVATAKELRGGAEPSRALERALSLLSDRGFNPQYLELRRVPDLADVIGAAAPLDAKTPYLLATATFSSKEPGATRLIDNVILNPRELTKLGIRTHGLEDLAR